jgi:hypothetical protein
MKYVKPWKKIISSYDDSFLNAFYVYVLQFCDVYASFRKAWLNVFLFKNMFIII